MSSEESPTGNRRDFLTGKALRRQVEHGGELLADELTAGEQRPQPPRAADTVRLQTRAMACDFAVIMNPDYGDQIPTASAALEEIHALERQMTVYREDSELAEINRTAGEAPVVVERGLFGLLQQAQRLSRETGGAFDPTAGPLICLWRRCRDERRLPTAEELAAARERMGAEHLEFDAAASTVRFLRAGLSLDLGGIGKGFALDVAAERLRDDGLRNFLFHGGHSSLLARGEHTGCDGWPVGIRDPFFPRQTYATLVLRDRGLSTSGSGVQFFRHEGKRYGHILDPRSGMPAEGMLSVTVVAPSAAEADALSTAFFVMGLEKARAYCNNRKEIAAVLFPLPERGRTPAPVLCNIGPETFFVEPLCRDA